MAVSNPKYRETLFELVSESEKHANMVQALMDMVILPKEYQTSALHQATFDFRGKSEFDVMLELMNYEQVALDLYSDIKEAIEKSNLQGYIKPELMGHFMAILDELIHDEAQHKDLLYAHVGRVKMIR